MLQSISSLDGHTLLLLCLSLGIALAFEFVNGFHDTANAVATVIYTKSLGARSAVVLSGLCNFLGVSLGGIAVAYAIVHLLPVDLLVSVNSTIGLAMVFSLLVSAILWNFATWYLGLPASSSHTLIGSILGVGLANALREGLPRALPQALAAARIYTEGRRRWRPFNLGHTKHIQQMRGRSCPGSPSVRR